MLKSVKKNERNVGSLSERKQFWLSVRDKLKTEKMKLIQIKRRHKNTKRSLSSTNDYRITYDMFDEPSEMKKIKFNSKHQEKKMEEPMKGYLDDMSLLMDDPLMGDISIIGSSYPAGKTSFAQWKQKKELSNLTIMEDNILWGWF